MERLRTSFAILPTIALIGLSVACGDSSEPGPAASPDDDGATSSGAGGDSSSSSSSSSSSAGGEAPETDTDPPTVVEVVPAPGTAGVSADEPIVFTFSEAMDQQSVASAFYSPELGIDDVDFEWNEAGDTVTIRPIEPLEYAEGTTIDMPALSYSVALLKAATDVAGNQLTAGAETSFTTYRRITLSAIQDVALTRSKSTLAPTTVATPRVGDSGYMNAHHRTYVTFDLAPVPVEVSTIERATLIGMHATVWGNPDTDLGDLVAEHYMYASVSALNQASLMDPGGTMSPPAVANGPSHEIDLTSLVQEDLDARVERGDLSQIRLRYTTDTDGDSSNDMVAFDPAFSLSIEILAE